MFCDVNVLGCPEMSVKSATHIKGNVLRNCDLEGAQGVLEPRTEAESNVCIN